MNVVLFVPLGFVYALSRARARSGAEVPWLGALAVGAVLSGMVEVAQLFAPSRFPSIFDLAANTGGAGVGAWLAGRAVASARARGDAAHAVRALAVDLPLMGLTYLMAPLVWLVAVGAGDSQRLWITAPLAAAATWAIAAVFTSFAEVPRSRMLIAAGAWLAVALLPSAVQRPGSTVAIASIALAIAWVRTIAPSSLTHEASEGRASRRFEAATLRVVFPLFTLYLLLSAVTPLDSAWDSWSGELGLVPRSRDDIYRALEQIAAFALLGYAVAESQGRARDGLHRLLPTVLVWTAPASAALQGVRGWHPEHGASGLLLALTILGATGGGWIYALQLEHVRALAPRHRSTSVA